jgi:hypothetical protein
LGHSNAVKSTAIGAAREEIDLGRHPRTVQRAHEIGGKNDAALEDGHRQQAIEPGGSNLPGQRVDALRYGLGRENDLDSLRRWRPSIWHARPWAIVGATVIAELRARRWVNCAGLAPSVRHNPDH